MSELENAITYACIFLKNYFICIIQRQNNPARVFPRSGADPDFGEHVSFTAGFIIYKA